MTLLHRLIRRISRTFDALERRKQVHPGNQYPRLILPHDPFGKRSSTNVAVCKSVSNYGLTRLGSDDFNPSAAWTICAYAIKYLQLIFALTSLFASLGLLSVYNSTEFVLETNINDKYREIQLALLSKQIIKLTHRGLIMFFFFDA